MCFEHDEEYLFNRLVCFERVESLATDEVGLDLPTLHRYIVAERPSRVVGLNAILTEDAAASRAMQKIAHYWQRLLLSKGNPVRTTVKVLDLYVQELQRHSDDVVLFVDYLQKIPLNRNREDVGDVGLPNLSNKALTKIPPVYGAGGSLKKT